MNCTKIEELLPLYVEGDLDRRETDRLRAHLSSCDDCRSLEEEFRASQQRLHDFAVPDFGAEFYAGIRESVLAEINGNRPVARPTFLQPLRTFFQWRPAMAASLALLVLFVALSFGLYRSLVKRETALAALSEKMGEFSPSLFPEATGQSVKDDSIKNSGRLNEPRFIARSTMRQKSMPAVQRTPRPESSTPQEIDTAAAVKMTPAAAAAATGSADSTQAIARMEIQTSDPSIRIIWLGRKASE